MQNSLQQYKSPNGNIGEALSGLVYQEAYSNYVKHPERELFVPITQWINCTSVTENDSFSLKPYIFTPAIFTGGTTAFFPNHEHCPHRIKFNHKATTFGNTMLNFKFCSANIQDSQWPNKECNSFGPTGQMIVDVKTCILFIIQDMQEGDMLCGRYFYVWHFDVQ